MESESPEQPACSETQVLDEGLEFVFFGMIRQGNCSDAIDFMRSLDVNIIPSKAVFRAIIFDVLMKCDDIKCLAFSSDYLVTILSVFPPSTESRRTYYFDCIRDSQGYLDDLWTVFSHIVNSYYYHRSIYAIEKGESRTELIKYPNCKFLLEFYVKLFVNDFEYLYAKSFQPCLLMQLLWHGQNNIYLSVRTEQLLKWINDIYGTPLVHKMGDLLGCLHDILTLMIKSFFQAKFNLSEVAAFKPSCLSEVVEATVNFCKNSYANHKNAKLLLIKLSPVKAFQIRVSERIIKQLTRQVSKRTYVLTLKDIVNQCLFPQKSGNKWKTTKPIKNKEKNLRKRPEKEKKTSTTTSDKKKETTKLHELAKNNQFGDLMEEIEKNPNDINAVDSLGYTPLHVACEEIHYLTVKVLISENKKALFFGFPASFNGRFCIQEK